MKSRRADEYREGGRELEGDNYSRENGHHEEQSAIKPRQADHRGWYIEH